MQQTEEKKNVFLTREFVLGGTIPLDFSKKIKFFQKLFFMCIYAKFNLDSVKTVGFLRYLRVLKLLLFFWQDVSENLPNNAHSNGFTLRFWATLDLKFTGFA